MKIKNIKRKTNVKNIQSKIRKEKTRQKEASKTRKDHRRRQRKNCRHKKRDSAKVRVIEIRKLVASNGRTNFTIHVF